jgi:hypothetical protein
MKYAAIAVVALMFVSGCGGSSSQAPTMTGTWNFSSNSQSLGSQYSGTATIQQTGSSITGSTPLSGLICATQASISGSIAGTNLTMQFNLNSPAANPEPDTMFGYVYVLGLHKWRPRHLDCDEAVTPVGIAEARAALQRLLD